MTVFKRKIDESLQNWKESPRRQPLLIRGARQVGKSYAVRQLGQRSYENFFEINFEQKSSFKRVFEGDLDPLRIVSDLSLMFGKQIRPERDLIFFDEIQECPRAIIALRYIYEQANQFHVIAAGSLLEFALEKISSPVGRIAHEFMYPMCFSEFLLATNQGHLISHLPVLSKPETWVKNDMADTLLTSALRDYFSVGGMPAAIRAFLPGRDFLAVAAVQDLILQSFRDDIRKYSRGDLQSGNVETILESGIKHVGKQIKYTSLTQDSDIRRTKASLSLLEKACLLQRIRSVNPSGLPLGADVSEKYFKLQFLDIGLGQRWAGFSALELQGDTDLLGLYEGRVAEQFVGQQLLAESGIGSESRYLFCWIRAEKNSQAEVDFILARQGKILALEVKSGTSGRLKSLNLIKEKYDSVSRKICVQYRGDCVENQGILYMPLYSIL